jgi:hypothetical protein
VRSSLFWPTRCCEDHVKVPDPGLLNDEVQRGKFQNSLVEFDRVLPL